MSNLILRPSNFGELMTFAQMAAKSKMVPAAMQGKPEDIMLAIQMGSELGLAPMQAIQNVAVINGRPAVWGDALIGLCRASPQCEDVQERMEGDGDTLAAICVAKRRGASPVTARFAVADAKKAGLWGKQGPWQQYPARMLQLRARGFALRDAFPDVLRGIISAEEARDIPADKSFTGTTVDAVVEPVTPPLPAKPQMTIEAWVDGTIARFAAAVTQEDVDALCQNEILGNALERLMTSHPLLYAKVDAARSAAMDRMADNMPLDPASPDEGDGVAAKVGMY